MKVLSAQQIRDWDAYTIKNEPIRSIDLMNRAAAACRKHLASIIRNYDTVRIFCGKGNNGGDGIAMAVGWKQEGIQSKVYIVGDASGGSEDFEQQLQTAKAQQLDLYYIFSNNDFLAIEKTDLIIEALFGSGLNRPLSGLYAETVEMLNASNATIIAVDLPAGLFCDRSSKGNPVIKAAETITFQSPKICFMMAENGPFFGKITLADIGLLPEFLEQVEAPVFVDEEYVRPLYKKRSPFSHKGNFGHALIIAGNYGKMGAALMCSKACLKTGAGLVTLDTPKAFLNAIHSYCPELMCKIREEYQTYTSYNTIGIGPGMGTESASKELLLKVLKQFDKPVLIDADAITILSGVENPLGNLPENSILTPHPKEFDRLFGQSENEFERMEKAVRLSKEHPLVLVLKGHRTLIAFRGKCWFNSTGNAGLAKGGSGDVLSGMITALLAQSYSPLQAAILGVYLHGSAADFTAKKIAPESMMATDVIDHISDAFTAIGSKE